jgi:hypothetical protein
MAVWEHARKGRIAGTIVRDDGVFVDIELAEDHPNVGREGSDAGETVCVRKEFLELIEK